MKSVKRYKIKYTYNKPNTPEEKERQQKILDKAYNLFFRKVVERFTNGTLQGLKRITRL